jgi:hypothetical protein
VTNLTTSSTRLAAFDEPGFACRRVRRDESVRSAHRDQRARSSEGQGRARLEVRLEAGSCVHWPPGIRHRELGYSDDGELLEIVLLADCATEEAASGDG